METISQQKQELTRMIESVNDPEILEAVKDLLDESKSQSVWKSR